MRASGPPLHHSSRPSTRYRTLPALRILTTACAIEFRSNDALHPTQNTTSGEGDCSTPAALNHDPRVSLFFPYRFFVLFAFSKSGRCSGSGPRPSFTSFSFTSSQSASNGMSAWHTLSHAPHPVHSYTARVNSRETSLPFSSFVGLRRR